MKRAAEIMTLIGTHYDGTIQNVTLGDAMIMTDEDTNMSCTNSGQKAAMMEELMSELLILIGFVPPKKRNESWKILVMDRDALQTRLDFLRKKPAKAGSKPVPRTTTINKRGEQSKHKNTRVAPASTKKVPTNEPKLTTKRGEKPKSTERKTKISMPSEPNAVKKHSHQVKPRTEDVKVVAEVSGYFRTPLLAIARIMRIRAKEGKAVDDYDIVGTSEKHIAAMNDHRFRTVLHMLGVKSSGYDAEEKWTFTSALSRT